MLTVVVAARQPDSQRRYRAVLKQASVATLYVTDLEQLIRCVRTRPIDIVLFDLDDPRWPARKWLDAASVDSDLAAVPVVWVGSEAPAPDMEAVKQYRPGIHLSRLPDAPTLSTVLADLSGAAKRDTDSAQAASAGADPDAWKPAVNTIDDALSIFADSADSPKGSDVSKSVPKRSQDIGPAARSHPADADHEDYDVFVAQMVKTEPHPVLHESTPGLVDTDIPAGTEKGILIPHPDDEEIVLPTDPTLQDSTGVGLSMMSGLDAADERTDLRSESQPDNDAEQALVDRIAGEVAARLAAELAKKLDPAAIRRAVEASLTDTR